MGALLDCEVYVDPEVLNHDLVVFAAGTQTESVRVRTRELFGSEQVTTVPLVKQAERAATTRSVGGERPAGPGRRPASSVVAGCEPALSHWSPAVCPNDTAPSMSWN